MGMIYWWGRNVNHKLNHFNAENLQRLERSSSPPQQVSLDQCYFSCDFSVTFSITVMVFQFQFQFSYNFSVTISVIWFFSYNYSYFKLNVCKFYQKYRTYEVAYRLSIGTKIGDLEWHNRSLSLSDEERIYTVNYVLQEFFSYYNLSIT